MKKTKKLLSVLLVLALALSMMVPTAMAAKKEYKSPVMKGGENWYKNAAVKKGAIVFQNDFENENGNFLDGSNSFNYAGTKATKDVAHSGSMSVLASARKYEDAGIGVRMSAVNGLDIKKLVGCTVKFSAWVYFKDSAYFKAPSNVNFVIWNRLNKIGEKDGTAVYKKVLKKNVKKGTWVQLVSTFKIVDPTDNGMILIGTNGEKANKAGYLSEYYMDDVKLQVVSLPKK